jgi:predicted methyltransferase
MDDAMKNGALLSLAIAAAAGIAGCGQRKEVEVTETNADRTVEPERPRPVESPGPGGPDPHHTFADPAERAKMWNDSARDAWQRPEEIVAALALTPGRRLHGGPLSKAVGPGGTVLAVDASAAMVEYLAGHRADLGPARIVPRKVGPDDPELPAGGVDAVLTLDTWHHVRGREAYAKKVYEGLKQGGRFVVVDYEVDAAVGPPAAMRVAPGQVAKHLEAAGFRVEVVRESMPRHYMVVGHKD